MKVIIMKISVIMSIILAILSCMSVEDSIQVNDQKLFSNLVAVMGSKGDLTYRSLKIERSSTGRLIVTAEKLAISETGPFIVAFIQGKTLTFSGLAHCGTVQTRTPVKISFKKELTYEEEMRIDTIRFRGYPKDLIVRK
jgi:hypothetical protein